MLTQLYYISSEEYDAFIVAEHINDAIHCWKRQQIDCIEMFDADALRAEIAKVGDPETIHILTSTTPLLFTQPVFRMVDLDTVEGEGYEQLSTEHQDT